MSKNEEYQKILEGLNPEEIAGKMSGVMMVMVKNPKDEPISVDPYSHAMESMTKEEMAYIVCVHAAISIEDAINQIPPLKKMIEAMKEAEALESNLKNKS
jgi:hypothetical protein